MALASQNLGPQDSAKYTGDAGAPGTMPVHTDPLEIFFHPQASHTRMHACMVPVIFHLPSDPFLVF